MWADIPYVKKVQSSPAQVWVPVYVSSAASLSSALTAIQVSNVYLGPAWGCMCAVVCVTFLTMWVLCARVAFGQTDDEFDNTTYVPKVPEPIPTTAQPVQTIRPDMGGEANIAKV